MDIKWDGLARVAGVGAAFAIGGAVIFALGVLGLSRANTARDAGQSGTARVGGLVVAGVAFAICAALVLYGLWLLIPQFH